nr:MAG TPA: LydA-holin antagonist [Caudoviricetes sp.]
MQIRVLHSNSYIHPFIYLYIYIYLFTGKTEKYRIFPKKKQKTEKSRRKTKTGQFPANSRKINPVSNILKSKAYI